MPICSPSYTTSEAQTHTFCNRSCTNKELAFRVGQIVLSLLLITGGIAIGVNAFPSIFSTSLARMIGGIAFAGVGVILNAHVLVQHYRSSQANQLETVLVDNTKTKKIDPHTFQEETETQVIWCASQDVNVAKEIGRQIHSYLEKGMDWDSIVYQLQQNTAHRAVVCLVTKREKKLAVASFGGAMIEEDTTNMTLNVLAPAKFTKRKSTDKLVLPMSDNQPFTVSFNDLQFTYSLSPRDKPSEEREDQGQV